LMHVNALALHRISFAIVEQNIIQIHADANNAYHLQQDVVTETYGIQLYVDVNNALLLHLVVLPDKTGILQDVLVN
ncbi:MAG: hypothetical protein ACKO96_48685, partial [Flammeovirgaceae bacterium]